MSHAGVVGEAPGQVIAVALGGEGTLAPKRYDTVEPLTATVPPVGTTRVTPS
jgi:hypothetical protein